MIGGKKMSNENKTTETVSQGQCNDEIIGILRAISIVSKRLAENLDHLGAGTKKGSQ